MTTRTCKVLTRTELILKLEELQPEGWAVYGDHLAHTTLARISDYVGKAFSKTGSSTRVLTRVMGPSENTIRRTADPSFIFRNKEGKREILNWQDWDTPGPTHVILPRRLLSTDAPEMFDANVLFTPNPATTVRIPTTAPNSPIFVCYIGGLK